MAWHHLTPIQQLEIKQTHLGCQFRWQIALDTEHMWEFEERARNSLESGTDTNGATQKVLPFLGRQAAKSFILPTRLAFSEVSSPSSDDALKFISLLRERVEFLLLTWTVSVEHRRAKVFRGGKKCQSYKFGAVEKSQRWGEGRRKAFNETSRGWLRYRCSLHEPAEVLKIQLVSAVSLHS